MKIGFAIVSHNHPEQLRQLVTTLTGLFDAPPIACHHHFGKCPLRPEDFPSNVRFVVPHIDARWGHVTLPLAALSALRLLRQYGQPDWFFLLSGSDYPVRPADEVINDLSVTDYDAFLDHREILHNAVPPGQVSRCGFGRPDWIPLAYDRYCVYRFRLICPSRALLYSGSFPFRKREFFIRNPGLIRLVEWFQPRLKACRPARIYGGDFWFHANQKAIERLLDSPLEKLARYYQNIFVPEESFLHTALCNHADVRICADHKRYEDWSRGEIHPKWLEESDVPKIRASGAYFARKFRPDGIVQRLIDDEALRISTL